MRKSVTSLIMGLAGAAMLAGVAVPAAAQTIIGPEADACTPGAGGPAVLVRVYGFKERVGNLRVQIYGANPDDFLTKGRKLKRIDLPVTAAGDMNVCVALPNYGRFAVAVRHDMDANGKSGWSDGGGFSRNPDISITRLKPDYEDVAITARPGVTLADVVLNYRKGLSIKPVVEARK